MKQQVIKYRMGMCTESHAEQCLAHGQSYSSESSYALVDGKMDPAADNMGVLYRIEPPHMEQRSNYLFFYSSGDSYDYGSCCGRVSTRINV